MPSTYPISCKNINDKSKSQRDKFASTYAFKTCGHWGKEMKWKTNFAN